MPRTVTSFARSRTLLIGTALLLASGCGASTPISKGGSSPGADAGPNGGVDGGGGTSPDAGVDGGGGTSPDAGVDGGGGTSPDAGVQCLSNSDCTSLRMPICENNMCVQCVTNGDCEKPPFATPFCHNNVCVGCLSDNDCNGLVCCSGDCVDTMTYSNDCGACGNSCPSGTACQSGACH